MFYQKHRQGEHVSIVGPTGSGKSLLGIELCKCIGARKSKDGRPARVTVLAFKPTDDTVSALKWPQIKKWPPAYGQEHCVVWPKARNPETAAREQRAVFAPLLNQIYQEGGQTVYIGEAAYFERPLPNGMGLSGTMERYWTTARSLNLTLVADTQRPRHVTRSMWSEPSWLFIFPPDDAEDTKRIAELSGRRMDIWRILPTLGEHEFLCVARQRGKNGLKAMYISKVIAYSDR